jgi:tryptophan halogenase
VLAIGLASGFLEPLESTSIHLIQTAVEKLIDLFPDKSFRAADIDFYNRATALEFEQVRDLIIFHYFANGRDDSEFWKQCRELDIPDSLKARIELYKGYGRVFRTQDELFSPVSWTSVFEGQGLHAEGFDPLTAGMPIERIDSVLKQTRAMVAKAVEAMPRHADFVAGICGSVGAEGG